MTKPVLGVAITGVGLWTRGLTSFAEFRAARESGFDDLEASDFKVPRPSSLPARERRRAGLMIGLGVEVAHQACEVAGVPKDSVPSVFTSALGDTAITEYMCRRLAQPMKALSPTRFHNSVHNAASGYWTISARNRSPSTFVGAFLGSFGAGLLEAASQSVAARGPVLFVACDLATEPPLTAVADVRQTLAAAFVLEPAEGVARHRPCLRGEIRFRTGPLRATPLPAGLEWLGQVNPMGCALTLADRLAASEDDPSRRGSLRFAAGPRCGIDLRLQGGRGWRD